MSFHYATTTSSSLIRTCASRRTKSPTTGRRRSSPPASTSATPAARNTSKPTASHSTSRPRPAISRMFEGEVGPDFSSRLKKRIGRKTGNYQLKNATVTTCCDGPRPGWTLALARAVVDPNKRVTARGSVFRLENVPLFYLPYVTVPSSDRSRSTGFLIPSTSTSTTKGRSLRESFYWAINRSADATFTGEYFSKRGPAGAIDFRAIPDKNSWIQVRIDSSRGTSWARAGRARGFWVTAISARGFRGVVDMNLVSSFVFRQVYEDGFNIISSPLEHSLAFASRNHAERQHQLSLRAKRHLLYRSADCRAAASSRHSSLALPSRPLGKPAALFQRRDEYCRHCAARCSDHHADVCGAIRFASRARDADRPFQPPRLEPAARLSRNVLHAVAPVSTRARRFAESILVRLQLEVCRAAARAGLRKLASRDRAERRDSICRRSGSFPEHHRRGRRRSGHATPTKSNTASRIDSSRRAKCFRGDWLRSTSSIRHSAARSFPGRRNVFAPVLDITGFAFADGKRRTSPNRFDDAAFDERVHVDGSSKWTTIRAITCFEAPASSGMRIAVSSAAAFRISSPAAAPSRFRTISCAALSAYGNQLKPVERGFRVFVRRPALTFPGVGRRGWL